MTNPPANILAALAILNSTRFLRQQPRRLVQHFLGDEESLAVKFARLGEAGVLVRPCVIVTAVRLPWAPLGTRVLVALGPRNPQTGR